MPTTDELRFREDAQWGLLLVIDGIRQAFVSTRHMLTLSTGDGRELRLGLIRRGLRRRLETDLRLPRLPTSPMRIQIHDYAGDLATVFRSHVQDVEPLMQAVRSGENLSSRTELHDRFVGLERIGPDGERRRYPAPLGDTTSYHHYGGAADERRIPLRPAPVSEDPAIHKGRRVVLYRCYRDHLTAPTDLAAGWRPIAEAERIWWGTLRDEGNVEGRTWTLDCDGPESWLQKDLGLTAQVTAEHAQVVFRARPEERAIAISFRAYSSTSLLHEFYGIDAYTTTITPDLTRAEIIGEINSALQACANVAGPDGAWYTFGLSRTVQMQQGSGKISIGKGQEADGVGRLGILSLSMHRSVWTYLGYDIEQQRTLGDSYYGDDERYVYFEPDDGSDFASTPPWSEYWIGRFSTFKLGGNPGDVFDWFNKGIPRTYMPLYTGNAVLDPSKVGGEGIVLSLGLPGDTVIGHPGQLHAAPRSSTVDLSEPYDLPNAGEVNRQGLWLLTGPHRYLDEEEPFDDYQIGVASWRSGTGSQDGLVQDSEIVLTRLLDPKLFGFSTILLASAWHTPDGVNNHLSAQPIFLLGYETDNGLDESQELIQRMLKTTGSSGGWFTDPPTYSDPAYSGENHFLEPGDNEGSPGTIRHDAEIADLGLGVPASMVASRDDFAAVAASTNAGGTALLSKLAITPGVNAEDVLAAWMAPVGWCWHLRGGRYGIFSPVDGVADQDVEVVFNRSTKEGRFSTQNKEPVDQDLRFYAPIDKFELEYARTPLGEVQTFEYHSPDAGRRYRTGGVPYKVPAWGLPFLADGWLSRARALGEFWSQRHFAIKGYPVRPHVGRRCWPGTIGRFSDPAAMDPSGTYGVTNRKCIVYAVDEDLGEDTGGFRVELLVLAEIATVQRVHAPSARGRGFDNDNDRIYCYDNWLGLPGERYDVLSFVEPQLGGLELFGGDLRIVWWQWLGDGWQQTGSGIVATVNADTPGSTYIELSSMTGRYLYAADTLVVPADASEQDAAWALAMLGTIGDKAGEFASAPVPRWEP